jgi:NAD(P)-dependent dehydrogenase (short-subunit alcohol dehydrogenase family)
LINNASSFSHDSLESLTGESWDHHILTNLRAPVFLTQRFVHHLRGGAGHIIHILDQRVLNLTPHYVSYSISKSGLWAFTQMMALALAPQVRVNAIGPGPTLANAFQDAALFERQWSKIPLQRPVDPLDITRAVQFLIETSSLTGQLITPDGGQHLGWTFPTAPVESRDE